VGIRATPIAEAMLACVLMDHALRHRAQCGDVEPPIRPIPEGTLEIARLFELERVGVEQSQADVLVMSVSFG